MKVILIMLILYVIYMIIGNKKNIHFDSALIHPASL